MPCFGLFSSAFFFLRAHVSRGQVCIHSRFLLYHVQCACLVWRILGRCWYVFSRAGRACVRLGLNVACLFLLVSSLLHASGVHRWFMFVLPSDYVLYMFCCEPDLYRMFSNTAVVVPFVSLNFGCIHGGNFRAVALPPPERLDACCPIGAESCCCAPILFIRKRT